jgi:hypothetical protein
MPTYARTRQFDRDRRRLRVTDKDRYRLAFRKFDVDLRAGRFRPGLRVKGVQGAPGVFEMNWAPDGRATFEYGQSQAAGADVIWRRIGTHGVLMATLSR